MYHGAAQSHQTHQHQHQPAAAAAPSFGRRSAQRVEVVLKEGQVGFGVSTVWGSRVGCSWANVVVRAKGGAGRPRCAEKATFRGALPRIEGVWSAVSKEGGGEAHVSFIPLQERWLWLRCAPFVDLCDGATSILFSLLADAYAQSVCFCERDLCSHFF